MNIYKVNHLTERNTTSKIIVFYGVSLDETETDEKLDDLFRENPQDEIFTNLATGQPIFSLAELENIRQNNIPVIFSEKQIHEDDNIGTIKQKIFTELGDTTSLDEMYLFCEMEDILKTSTVYETLSQQNSHKISKTEFENFLKNIISLPQSVTVPEKDEYGYDDLLSLQLDNTPQIITRPIGQKIVKRGIGSINEYSFVANPFLFVNYVVSGISGVQRAITTLNSHLLLNTGTILNNTIYLCTAKEVIRDQDSAMIQLYYPFLYEKEIFTLNELNEKREDLINANRKTVEESKKMFEKIDIIYDIYKFRKPDKELNYVNRGIKSLVVSVYAPDKIKIPTDIIFKLIHATEQYPLVKYNPGHRQEKLMRLYSPEKSTDGRKIPFLSKADINKFKTVGQPRTVVVYIPEIYGTCEFDETGSLLITSDFPKILSVQEIDELYTRSIFPLVDEVKQYLDQNGYIIASFVSLEDKTTDIIDMKYQTVIKINNANFTESKKCMSSVFLFESKQLLRFKRVSNFSKTSSMEAFIIESIKKNQRLKNGEFYSADIIKKLLEDYEDITEEDALDLFRKVVNELQVEQNSKRRAIEIKVNPGFKTTLSLNKFTENLTINMEDINDIGYLKTIPIYLDTLVRLVQDKKSTEVSEKEIKKLCTVSKKADTEDIVEDVIALEEQSYKEQVEQIEDMEEEELDEDKKLLKAEMQQKLLDAFFGEGDEDEEEEEEGDEQIGGGVRAEGGGEKNIDGLKLNNPSYWQERIEKKDPIIILKEEEPGFNAYSKVCPSNQRRQPVILTKEELEDIQRSNPGFLDEKEGDVVKYGSTPDNQYYYICPKYWNLRDDTLITEEEIIKNKLQDKIIPEKAKKVEDGKYIFQFYDDSGERKRFPGFQTNSHPKGYCLPCCFKKWNTKELTNKRKICSGNVEEEPLGEKNASSKEYIVGAEKVQIPVGRWGYLPIAVQKLLQEVNANCQISKTNAMLKSNYPCLLRHGIKNNSDKSNGTQSFIACIADALFYTKSDTEGNPIHVTIQEMKEIIISTLTLDNFITLQNGNLVTNFYSEPNSSLLKEGEEVESQVKMESNFYKKCQALSDGSGAALFKKVSNAFDNFIRYLRDDEILIDYTYLWDLISRPNPNLFKDGINLVVLEIPNEDITNNVNIICPTNHYSSDFYNERKPTLILVGQDKYFEPVYSYKEDRSDKKQKKIAVQKFFIEAEPARLSANMKNFFEKIVRPYFQNKCVPFSSMPKLYKAKRSLLLSKLVNMLNELGYSPLFQVMNYHNKIIGVVAEAPSVAGIESTNKLVGFVPCYPSSALENMEYIFMTDDDKIWKTYEETMLFLKTLSKDSNTRIPCLPAFSIVEEEVVVGILTETNQFIQISQPLPVSELDPNNAIPEFRSSNHVVADKEIALSTGPDKERIEYIKKIKLETQFFQVFRNTIRIMLNEYENLGKREKIEDELGKMYILYNEKLKTIVDMLKDLVNEQVIFVENFDYSLVNEVSTCIMNRDDPEKCASKSPFCAVTTTNRCQLLIPKFNLLTGSNNELKYYLRMADELVRYTRIKSFVFEPQSYLSFGNIDYNLRKDELIVIQSILEQDYFDNLVPVKDNIYVKYNTHDQAQPQITQAYSNVVEI
jgi:hypothetical protein